ncbi:CCR4-NOT transcription complex subunit 3-like protein [Drosera capensis]
MGASRKLQGEIDRVLKKVQEGVDVFDSIWNKVYDTDNMNQKEKFEADLKKEIKKLQRYRDQIKTWLQSSEIKDKKVSASYEQALLDARKLIEREMERFKICEKETKTKAFSKEGLVQQPKTDPKEKAKSETRDWLNNVVGELELQIDTFEAEMEGLSVKKGKARPPRLIHLETSIARHKAHIMKLELILRLLDNEELSPEQINDVKDFLEDYVERNQEDFDEFSDVDELYNTLPLDNVESLEELATIVAPSLVKGSAATSSVISLKASLAPSSPTPVAPTSSQQSASAQEPTEETASQDTNPESGPRTPPSKPNAVTSSAFSIPLGVHPTSLPLNVSAHVSGVSSAPSGIPGSIPARSIVDTVSAAVSSQLSISVPAIEEESVNVPDRRPSPVLADVGLKGIGKTSPVPSVPPSPGAVPSSNMTLGAVPLASEVAKRNILGADERLASSVVAGRASPSFPGVQWRPGTSFQNQTEFRGRPEIAPDQREKFLQRFQQVQQQGQNNVLGGMPALGSGNQKQLPGQQQNSLLPQLNSLSSPLTPQVGLGLGIQSSGLNTSMPMSLQQSPSLHQQAAQQGSVTNGPRDADVGYTTAEEQQQNLGDPTAEVIPGSSLVKSLMNEDELKASFVKDVPTRDSPSPLMESMQLQRDTDLSPGFLHPSQPSPSAGLGVIGRRSVANLGATGDSVTPNHEGMHDQMYCLQMLEAAFHKLPQPKDSERSKSYIPRNPAATPSSFPQVQAPIVNNPAFWERLGMDPSGTDALFFAFYFQQNTYQQYLAARELKKQSWRYHRMWNMWFQRHEEPKIATDEYEKGTCQRLKHDFEFVYNYLEDELIV